MSVSIARPEGGHPDHQATPPDTPAPGAQMPGPKPGPVISHRLAGLIHAHSNGLQTLTLGAAAATIAGGLAVGAAVLIAGQWLEPPAIPAPDPRLAARAAGAQRAADLARAVAGTLAPTIWGMDRAAIGAALASVAAAPCRGAAWLDASGGAILTVGEVAGDVQVGRAPIITQGVAPATGSTAGAVEAGSIIVACPAPPLPPPSPPDLAPQRRAWRGWIATILAAAAGAAGAAWHCRNRVAKPILHLRQGLASGLLDCPRGSLGGFAGEIADLATFAQAETDRTLALEAALAEARAVLTGSGRAGDDAARTSEYFALAAGSLRLPAETILSSVQTAIRSIERLGADPGSGASSGEQSGGAPRRRSGDPPDARAELSRIESAGAQLLAMLGDCIDFAVLGMRGPVIQPIIAESIVARIADEAQQRHPWLTVDRVVAGDVGRVATDPARIERAFQALFAQVAATQARFARLTIAREGDMVAFHLTDTGHGLTAEQIDQVMAPSVDRGLGDQGLGANEVGLVLARLIAASLGGDLSIAAMTGQGAIYRFAIQDQAPLWPRPATRSLSAGTHA